MNYYGTSGALLNGRSLLVLLSWLVQAYTWQTMNKKEIMLQEHSGLFPNNQSKKAQA